VAHYILISEKMRKFKKISVIDVISVTSDVRSKIQELSDELVVFPDEDSKNEDEIIQRIGQADAVLGSWKSIINANILKQSSNLKYIGICGTNISGIEIKEVEKRNIVLKNVLDWGDEGVAEYIFAQLIKLFRGFGEYQWRDEPAELNSKTIGIVGLGAVGKHVARVALGFKMNVLYFSKTRNLELEEKGIRYASLGEVLNKSDIISLHVPKDLKIIGKNELVEIGDGKIIVDTCLGNVYENMDDLKEWLGHEHNFFIRDLQPEFYKKLHDVKGFIYTDNINAGITIEARERLGKKVLENIKNYLISFSQKVNH
jgi:phosphoglycerate dehydrogenase-like enzyme